MLASLQSGGGAGRRQSFFLDGDPRDGDRKMGWKVLGAGEWKGLLQVGGSKTAPLRRARGQTAGCGLLVARRQALDSRIADGRISHPAKHCRQHSHDPLGRNVLQTQGTPGCKRFVTLQGHPWHFAPTPGVPACFLLRGSGKRVV